MSRGFCCDYLSSIRSRSTAKQATAAWACSFTTGATNADKMINRRRDHDSLGFESEHDNNRNYYKVREQNVNRLTMLVSAFGHIAKLVSP